MKRILCLFFALIISVPVFATEISTISRERQEINVFLEDTLLTFDVPPVISGGRILAPIRSISESLGALVEWDSDTKTAGISLNNVSVYFTIGEKVMLLNDEKTDIDTAAAIINGRTFVPLRVLAEALGLDVKWDDDLKTAYLSVRSLLGKDYMISPAYYVATAAYEGCVIACKAMVLSNYFDRPFTFEEILELNGESVYANWGPEYSMDLIWKVLLESEYELKVDSENWAESAFTPAEKLNLIADELENSSGIIAQFVKDGKTHGVVITGYTAEGELIVCDPDTKSEAPENTLIKDSCLAKMFDLYTTDELLPYLYVMRTIEK